MDANYKKYNRIVNNVTLAMPHSGVISAASDQINGILQPSDLEGVGEYQVRASVVSPTINVLCANMNKSELSPIIYVDWPNAITNQSMSVPNQRVPWSGYTSEIVLEPGQKYLNSTAADNVFGWGVNDRQPPVFPMVSLEYVMIVIFLLTPCSYLSTTTPYSTFRYTKASLYIYLRNRVPQLTILSVR